MATQTTNSQANFNQPQSLVKYSNPVLVSTAGKKQNKVPHGVIGLVKNKPPEHRQHLHGRHPQLNPSPARVHHREAATVDPVSIGHSGHQAGRA